MLSQDFCISPLPTLLGDCVRSMARSARNFRPIGFIVVHLFRWYPEVLTWSMGKYLPYFSPNLQYLLRVSHSLSTSIIVGLCPFHSENCLWQHTPKFLFLHRVTSIYFLFIYLFYQFLVLAHYAIKCVYSLRCGKN